MYKRFHYGVASIAKSFGIDITVLTKIWEQIYLKREKSRGKESAVKFCKELNTVCERYALRQPIIPIPWTRSDKDGFPRILGEPFKVRLRSEDPRVVVFTLSVMRSCESMMLPISKDIETVTAPSRADTSTIEAIIEFIPTWLKRFKRIKLDRLIYHCTLKNGPNGPALRTSDTDLVSVMNDPVLWQAITTVSGKLNDRSLNRIYVDGSLQGIHSKLNQFPDKSGKTRTIGIIDYYSQRALKPLHESLMSFLGSLVSDGTYSHQNVGKFAQQKTLEKSFVYCADLTAFTDRFPAAIQRALLLKLLKDPELAQALWTLLAERQFTVAWSGEQVTYSCGQPMGAYASWPLCSLAHHLVIEYCAHLVGKPAKENYRQIGDDTIITEPAIAQKYQEVISALGVDINQGKTVLSAESSDYACAEVAKQLYLNGICLTPLTPGFVLNLWKPYMFNTCMEVLRSRYDWFRTETPSMLIETFYRKGTKDWDKVWLQATNPFTGSIKPLERGYNEHSPWIPMEIGDLEDRLRKMLIERFSRKHAKIVEAKLAQFTSQGSPWKGSTPPPRCLSYVSYEISKQFTNGLASLNRASSITDLRKFVEEFSFIPNPEVPYMERKELRQRRISSIIESLYYYDGSSMFVQMDW